MLSYNELVRGSLDDCCMWLSSACLVELEKVFGCSACGCDLPALWSWRRSLDVLHVVVICLPCGAGEGLWSVCHLPALWSWRRSLDGLCMWLSSALLEGLWMLVVVAFLNSSVCIVELERKVPDPVVVE